MLLCMTDLTDLTAEVAKMREQLNTHNAKIQRVLYGVEALESSFRILKIQGDQLTNVQRTLEHDVRMLKILVKELTKEQTTPNDLQQNVLYVHPMV